MDVITLQTRIPGRWFLVDDKGNKTPITHAELRELVAEINANPNGYQFAGSYACGVFHYTKPGTSRPFTVVRKGVAKLGKSK